VLPVKQKLALPELIPDPLWIGQSPQLMLSRPIQDVYTINGSGIRKIQPEVEKFNLKLNKKKAASFKHQA